MYHMGRLDKEAFVRDLNSSALAAQAGAGSKKAIQQINKLNKQSSKQAKKLDSAKKQGRVSTPMSENMEDWKCPIRILA